MINPVAKAFRAKDVDGVMSVFAQEIISFDILPPLQAGGSEIFVKHWQEFFDSYQDPIQGVHSKLYLHGHLFCRPTPVDHSVVRSANL